MDDSLKTMIYSYHIKFWVLACCCVSHTRCLDRIATGTRQAAHRAPNVVTTLTARSRIECLTICSKSQCSSYNYRTNAKECELISEINPTLSEDVLSDHVIVTLQVKHIVAIGRFLLSRICICICI